ncbi:MAG: HD domain-containing protein [Phycisphaeraceae bacterium]|nr:HD domain-containing protein [Phycisphaerales bacterium]MCB9844161.1 HD domain-containing protein [Phycisphaeraceae bacterium]
MRPIDPKTLQAGQVFPLPLYSKRGTKLLGAGIELTRDGARRLRRLAAGSIYMARTVGELSAAGVLEKRTKGLVEPKQAGGVVYEDARGLTGHSGYEMPLQFEHARRRAAILKVAEDVVWRRERLWSLIPGRVTRQTGGHGIESSDGRGWPAASELMRLRGERIEKIAVLLDRIVAMEPVGVGSCESIVGGLIDLFDRYPERFAQLALHGRPMDDYLPEHAFTAAALNVAIASHLEWPQRAVMNAGLAGLLSDVGMMLVPDRIRKTSRALDDAELHAARRHVWTGTALLTRIEGLPEAVIRSAHRHHERLDGSGYPRGLRGDRLDDVSRVVAVADAYAAATHPRVHKPAKRPYDAMAEIIALGSVGTLDRRAVHALVCAAGLFPVGTGVVLSTGETGVVVCVNRSSVDRPMVRVRGGTGERLIDLREDGRVRVVRASDYAMAA